MSLECKRFPCECCERNEELKAEVARLADLPLCRRQLPDGSVPCNTEEALAIWVRLADERGTEIERLKAALVEEQSRRGEGQ